MARSRRVLRVSRDAELPIHLPLVDMDFSRVGDRRLLLQSLAWGMPRAVLDTLPVQLLSIVHRSVDDRIKIDAAKVLAGMVAAQIALAKDIAPETVAEGDANLRDALAQAQQRMANDEGADDDDDLPAVDGPGALPQTP